MIPRKAQPGARRWRAGLAALVSAGALLAASVTIGPPARADTVSRYFMAYDGNGGLCMDLRGNQVQDYQPVQIYTCNGTQAQHWVQDYTDGTVRLAENMGMCLDVFAGGTWDGASVDLYHCNGTGAQIWGTDLWRSHFALYNPQSGKCLDDTNWSTYPGTQLQIWDCTGAANQDWHLQIA
jgi:chitinase